ncbi:GntR family transcriptional regulator [Leucobacter albus]|uniref:GntR family transcriptional regulator n=1 Tax=Leucobacter albus TaxID=272210 RepID=A0ABW3TM21_9MICO
MPVPVATREAPARSLLRDEVLEQLIEAITDGTLAPGERLRDQDLSAWLRVSRTPIREALGHLAKAGLVSLSPNRFTKVADVDPEVLAESCRALVVVVGGTVLVDPLAWSRARKHIPAATRLVTPRDTLHHFWELTASVVAGAASAALEDVVEQVRLVVARDLQFGSEWIDVKEYRGVAEAAFGPAPPDPGDAVRKYREMNAVLQRGCLLRLQTQSAS